MIAPLFAAALALAAAPQDLGKIANIAVLDGTCTTLTLPSGDETAGCRGKLLNTAYRDEHSSFMVSLGQDLLVSFYGEDHAAVGNRATLTIRKVTVNRLPENKPEVTAAEGECTYTNPYVGPSHVDCHAIAGGRTYAFSFVSDGKPPMVTRFPGDAPSN